MVSITAGITNYDVITNHVVTVSLNFAKTFDDHNSDAGTDERQNGLLS